MRKRRRALLVVLEIVAVLGVLFYKLDSETFDVEAVDASIKLSNIRIVSMIIERTEDFEHISYDSGSSGSIFYKSGNTYYALTACHVVSNERNSEYLVLTENDMNMREYLKNGGEYHGVDAYYAQFPTVTVVAMDVENDLAIISFESDQQLTTLHFAANEPSRGDPIITISNPDGQHGIVSSGKITDSKPQKIHYTNNDHDVMAIKHNAEISYGSSGSALLNTDYEIVGINIGGQKAKIFNFKLSFFDRGNAIPLEKVMKFVQESDIIMEDN